MKDYLIYLMAELRAANTTIILLLLLCMFPPVTRDAKNLTVGKLVV
jgi:hypothetical protein